MVTCAIQLWNSQTRCFSSQCDLRQSVSSEINADSPAAWAHSTRLHLAQQEVFHQQVRDVHTDVARREECVSDCWSVLLLHMDDTCSHELFDARTVVLVLLHLNFEEIIDRIVGGSPPIPVVTDSILYDSHRVLQRCGGLASLPILYQPNWPIYVYMGQFIYVYVCIHIMLVYVCIHHVYMWTLRSKLRCTR